jgi:diguanylate cyclase (GGDEF)-like protein
MQKIAILYDASQMLLSTFDMEEVLERIAETVRDYFNLDNGVLLLLDKKNQELYIGTHFGSMDVPLDLRVPMGVGLTGTAAKVKRPIYSPDVSKDNRYLKGTNSTRSELAIPLLVRDEVVGVLDIQKDVTDGFDRETIDLLTLFSTQASIAIQNSQLYTREHRRTRQLEAINAVAKETRSLLRLEELLPTICNLILQYFAVDHAAVLMLERRRLVQQAHKGKLTEITSGGVEMNYHAGISGHALAEGKTIVASRVRSFKGYVAGFEETEAEACIPLIALGQRLGVLVLENAKPDSFPDEEIHALEAVADICADAIHSAQSFKRMEEMADIDGLTGIYNRRHLEKRLLEELDRLARYGHGMGLLMIDIDHFKNLNDEFGHILGDEVLREVSLLFRKHLRKADVLCRYGGEEFAVLLPETTGEKAVRVADKLRRFVENHHFAGLGRPLTVSIGVADFPDHGRSRDDLVKAADMALYAAKDAGRNKVMRATAPAEESASAK